ncbi:MAG: MazG nucleotide pyrophosphohydrolase domain-containing protein, partial [Thermomicrobiales bacterium]
QIAREAGTFTMSNVIRSITAKMVRRHPHVFGNVEISDVEDLYRVWNEVKKQERLDKQRALGNGG